VIGVSVGQYKDGQNLNFAIPKSNLELLLKRKNSSTLSITKLDDIIRPFTDPRDEQTYKTVKIGNQIWMAENLNYASSSGSWCYNDNSANCAIFGRLYSWKTAISACPIGWNLPSNDDWHELALVQDPDAANEDIESLIAGDKLKNKTGWGNPSTGTTNESGFSALPGGSRDYNGVFGWAGSSGDWWSSTEYMSYVLCRSMHKDDNKVRAFTFSKSDGVGFSVRCIKDNTMTDQDGNVYKTITIGTQTWMAENLRTTKYQDGTAIPNETDFTAWKKLTTGAYCNFNNTTNAETIATYGRLYNWYAVADSRMIAPTGWHIPTDAEWTILSTYLGGEDVAGSKIQEIGTTHWIRPIPSGLATNESGFTALPSGYREGEGSDPEETGGFTWLGFIGSWWSITAATRELEGDTYFYQSSGFLSDGYAVRLVKN